MTCSTAELSILLLEHNICEVTRGQQSSDAEDAYVVGIALAGTHDAPHYIALNLLTPTMARPKCFTVSSLQIISQKLSPAVYLH